MFTTDGTPDERGLRGLTLISRIDADCADAYSGVTLISRIDADCADAYSGVMCFSAVKEVFVHHEWHNDSFNSDSHR